MSLRPFCQRLLAALGASLLIATLAWAGVVEEIIDLPVTVTDADGERIRQPIVVTVFRDDARRRAPFLLLLHGRSPLAADRARIGRIRYSDNARYFVELGFAVLVPTRIGYGVSGGPDIEHSGPCKNKDYAPAFDVIVQQSRALIDYATAQPYVRPHGVVVGQSFGGVAAIAVAARRLPGVLAAINFAGGGGGNAKTQPQQPCRDDLLADLFAGYGKTARMPTLWLYSENDQYFGIEKPQEWLRAFIGQGGRGDFVRLPPYRDDGHGSFTRNPEAWRPTVESFLRKVVRAQR